MAVQGTAMITPTLAIRCLRDGSARLYVRGRDGRLMYVAKVLGWELPDLVTLLANHYTKTPPVERRINPPGAKGGLDRRRYRK